MSFAFKLSPDFPEYMKFRFFLTTSTGFPIYEDHEEARVESPSSESVFLPPVKNPFNDDLNNSSFEDVSSLY